MQLLSQPVPAEAPVLPMPRVAAFNLAVQAESNTSHYPLQDIAKLVTGALLIQRGISADPRDSMVVATLEAKQKARAQGILAHGPSIRL